MDQDPNNWNQLLAEFVEKSKNSSAFWFLSDLPTTFNEELSERDIDLYVTCLFNDRKGNLLWFLQQILHNKIFEKVRTKALELVYVLLNNFPYKLKHRLDDIITTCLKLICSFASSKDREKALQILLLVISKPQLYIEDDTAKRIIEGLMSQWDFKNSDTIKSKLIAVIGAMIKSHPFLFARPSEVTSRMVRQLQNEICVTLSPPSLYVIEESVNALRDAFEQFPLDNSHPQYEVLYDCLKKLMTMESQRTFHIRAALNFLSQHAILFAKNFYTSLNWWHEQLLKFLLYRHEDQKAASSAIVAFYDAISQELLNADNMANNKAITRDFLRYFLKTINDSEKNNYEIRSAIRGLGIFAESFKVHLSSDENSKLFICLLNKVDCLYIYNPEPNTDDLQHLPTYVSTLSCFICHLEQVSSDQISHLQKILIFMIRIFPSLSQMHHNIVTETFVSAVFQLMKYKANIDDFVFDIMYQGVMWSCSHPFPIEGNEEFTSDNQNTKTYKNYLPFYNSVLKIAYVSQYKIEAYEKKKIVINIFDALIKALFVLINKLNLDIKKKEDHRTFSNFLAMIDIVHVNDYEIFLNLVALFQDILENVDKSVFEKWVNMFLDQLMSKSMKHTFISGFYKLLASCVKLCDKLNYFDNYEREDEVAVRFESLQVYLKEMLFRMKLYSGELQLACLELLTSTPCVLIKDLLLLCVPCFTTLFDIGRSFYKYAEIGIDTLERWNNNLATDEFEPFLKQVIPVLDSYLRSKSAQQLEGKSLVKTRKTQQVLKKRKIVVESDPELFNLQRKILTFVGQLSTDVCSTFVTSGSNIEHTTYSKKEFLKIKLPYEDRILDFYLDGLLPRTIELAMYCSNRKIRMAACELLQATTMLFLGISRNIAVSQLSTLDAHFKKIIDAVLCLGCDLDEPVKNVFEPVVMSMIHWYSHRLQLRSSHTAILIESLMELITHPANSAFRDFAGRCTKEFVIWTIKQSEPDSLSRDATNVKVLINKIMAFSLHSDPSKRLGAALIFNNIYQDIREEEAIVNMFWLEILYAFIVNISQESSFENENCLLQVKEALRHVERVLLQKHELFSTPDNNRRTPPHFQGNLLKDVMTWLLQFINSGNKHCRDVAMQLFSNIAEKTDSSCSIAKFVTVLTKTKDLQAWISNKLELHLTAQPAANETNTCDNLFKWVQNLDCSICGFLYFMKNGVVNLDYFKEGGNFISALTFFIQKICRSNIESALKLCTNGEAFFCSIKEKEQFNYWKSTIVINTMKFAAVIIQNTLQKSSQLWKNHLESLMHSLLAYVLFDFTSIGFDTTNTHIKEKELTELLQLILAKFNDNDLNKLAKAFTTYITENSLNKVDIKINVPLKYRNYLKGMILLQTVGFSNKINILHFERNIINAIFERVSCGSGALKETVHAYCNMKMQLTLENEIEFTQMIQCVHAEEIITVVHLGRDMSCGNYFFTSFKETIIQHVLKRFSYFFDTSITKSINVTVNYLVEILQYIGKNEKIISRDLIENIIEVLLANWFILGPYFCENREQINHGIEFVKQMASITSRSKWEMGQEKYALGKWIFALFEQEDISFEVTFNFRTQLFDLLVCVAGPHHENNEALSDILKNLQFLYFTHQTVLSENAVVLALNKLFNILQLTKSLIILQNLAEIYATTEYSMKDFNLTDILNGYMNNLDLDLQLTALTSIYNMRINKYEPLRQYTLATDFFLVLLVKCAERAIENFCLQHIQNVILLLQNESAVEDVLINKIFACVVLEVVFLRLDVSNSDVIAKAAFPDKKFSGKQFIGEVLKITLAVCKLSNDGTEHKELFRLYQCCNYKALVSVISNTQKIVNPYVFLFSREKNGEDHLWKNLIDTNKHYNFEVAFDSNIPDWKNKFVSIRDEVRANKRILGRHSATVQYMQSQNLYNSTLSDDVSKYDFTNTIVRTHLEERNKENNTDVTVCQEIELESLEINNHELMPTICGLICHIFKSGISRIPDEDEDVTLPPWMIAMKNVLVNGFTSVNIKIFLIKVVHNMKSYFEHYAKWFYKPVMQFIVDHCAGGNMNFFIYDLMEMIIYWSNKTSPEEDKDLPSKLLQFLIDNIDSDTTKIYKTNIELVKSFIEGWKDHLIVPYQQLLDYIKQPPTSKKLDIGVHLAAIFLANKIIPWEIKETRNFLQTLASVLKNNDKNIYRRTAEVLGMSLNHLNGIPGQEQFFNKLNTLVQKAIETFDESKFIYCLEGIALHHPPFADKYLCKLVFNLPTIPATFKTMYLKVLLARYEVLQTVSEFNSLDFKDLLEDTNVDSQILGLDLFCKCLDFITVEKLRSSIDIVANFSSHSNMSCRQITYDILLQIYQKYYLHVENNDIEKLLEFCKDLSLDGLLDKDPDIQQEIQNFWTNHLSKDINERFLELLKTLYKPKIEQYYLGYSSFLLLDVIKNANDFYKVLFENPLEVCTLEEYKLYGHWRAQHASVVPLFADTLRSQQMQYHSTQDLNPNVMRATKSQFEFDPTQAMKPSSYATKTYSKISSSLLFTQDESNEADSDSGVFKNPNFTQVSTKYRSKYRFLKDKSMISRHFAYEQVKKNVAHEKLRKDLAKQKEKGVRFYRSYRRGDFPDIQITLSDIVLPLQALAKQDSDIAKILYSNILQKTLSAMNGDDSYYTNIQMGINKIFKNSPCNSNVIGALLDIALSQKSRIRFSPDVIKDVCISSGHMPTGTLLLEEYLISEVDSHSLPTKKIKSDEENEENNHWIQLAELYKEMDEIGVTKGIFVEKLNCPEEHIFAINAEAEDNWKDAQNAYEQLLTNYTNLTTCRRDLYYESCFRCFANLSQWDKLSETIERNVTATDNKTLIALFDQDWNQRKLLPWYVKAELRNALCDKKKMNNFLSNINDCIKQPENYQYMKNNFAEELALLRILNGDIDEGKQHIQDSVSAFLESWSVMSPLFSKLRFNKLLNFCNTFNIYIFLQEYVKLYELNYTQVVKKLCKQWLRPQQSCPLILMESLTLYRKEFIDTLDQKLKLTVMDEDDYEDLHAKLNKTKFKLNLNLLNSALQQNNFYVARKYCQQQINSECDGNEKLELKVALSKVVYLRSYLLQEEQKLSCLLKSWDTLGPVINSPTNNIDIKLQVADHMFDVANDIHKTCSETPNLFLQYQNEIQRKMPNMNISDSDSVKHFGMERFHQATQECYEYLNQNANYEDKTLKNCVADAYMKLAYFAIENEGRLPEVLIVSVLRSMKLGSLDGIQLFPYILHSCDVGYAHKELFLREAADVPIWMFIRWIPHLLTYIDTKNIFGISGIIEKIARTYPQSIMYAYRLTKHASALADNEVKVAATQLTKILDELLLLDELVNKFLKALSALAMPKVILSHYLKNLREACVKNSSDTIQYMCDQLSEIYLERPDSKSASSIYGNIFKDIWPYKSSVTKLISTLSSRKPDLSGINKLLEELNKKRFNNSVNLIDYCPWLMNFSGFKMDAVLEIPGQYTGQKRPLPQYHVKINGFLSKVLVLKSLRKPIRLTILGNDTKEYPYLIKFGEDLRQDQRIEDLFNLMNDIFRKDKDASQHHLSLITYQVVPLTNSLGIIEWLEDSPVFEEFLNVNDAESIKMYEKLLNRASGSDNPSEKYAAACQKYTSENTIANYQAMVNQVPWDIWRKAFMDLSVNTESFVALKTNFIRSYGTMCASQWLLGIGDRHLENSMISLKNGCVIGIDFGHAFGTATQILPVPELVPFRLTPHLVNLMLPLGENGLFKDTLISTLHALKRNSKSLLATMNIFIKDPSMEWKNYAADYEAVHGESKIMQAKEKLKGVNPVVVLVKDLEANKFVRQKYLDVYVNLARGTVNNIRKKTNEYLSVEEQAQCLIDLATDRNILGRMYLGYRPWV